MIPELEPRCSSWVILDPHRDVPMLEPFSRRNAEKAAMAGYRVLTALQWLVALNQGSR